MSEPRTPLARPASDARTWASFLLLSAIWGSSFLFIKTSLDQGVPPLTIVSLRTLFGGLFLGLVVLLWGGRLPISRAFWGPMLVLGMTNIVVPFALIAWGQQYIPSGMAAILNALVPLFTIVLAALLLHDEDITLARLAGLAIGFVGVALLALPSVGAAGQDDEAVLALAAMLAVALAAVFYAIAAVYTRRRISGRPIASGRDGSARAPSPAETALGSNLVAFLAVTILAMTFEHPGEGVLAIPQTGTGWLSAIWLGVLGTGLAYLLFFRIIEHWGATRTTLVTYVIPLVAIVLGYIVLGERLRPIELAGAALVVGGVVLVNAGFGQRPLLSRSRSEP